MDEIEQDKAEARLICGRLEGIEFPDLMWSLCGRRATGVLEVTRGPVTRNLFLQDGRIVFASSSDPNDRLGEILLRAGKISLDQLESALRNLRSGKRLGVLLVEAGAMNEAELVEAVISQVKAVALDVLAWSEGRYRFHDGYLPNREMITLQMHTAELLVQSIRDVDSFSRIRGSVGAPHSAFALAENWQEIREGLRLVEEENVVLERLSPDPVSVEQLCEDLTMSDFDVYRTIWAFRVLGLVERRGEGTPGFGETVLARHFEENSFPEILVEMSRSGQTGLLYASRRDVERSFHLERGRCVFATSTHPDDGLVSYLLRRGVISLRDREETRKRLLSNKRVGTILRDLGVLDAKDLEQMVKEQLSEIVYDTIRWDDGAYVFIAGPLPTHEQIKLDADVARLMAEGIRRVDSWTRVIRGCGGVDNPLSLHPEYLGVMDRMGAGVEEMAVVNALKHPQSPRRVCRELNVGDFRVCQTLWALKLLGGVESARIDLNEQIPEDVPAPDHTDAGAAAVGQQLTDEVCAALVDLPDSADLISRQAIDAEQVPAVSEAVQHPPKMVPKSRETLAAREAAIGAEPATASPSDTPVPEMLELEDDDVLTAGGPSVPPSSADGPAVQPRTPDATESGTASVPAKTPGPDPTGELDEIVTRFNAMHRLVYSAVRAEIGAGAVNFVRSCCGQAEAGDADLLEGVELEADGSWNESELKQAIREHGVTEPWAVYQGVLDREFGLLAPHLGQSRATELQEQILALQHRTERQSYSGSGGAAGS